jgi:hypothetical protein
VVRRADFRSIRIEHPGPQDASSNALMLVASFQKKKPIVRPTPVILNSVQVNNARFGKVAQHLGLISTSVDADLSKKLHRERFPISKCRGLGKGEPQRLFWQSVTTLAQRNCTGGAAGK